jgi:hypothetical protein
VGKALSSLTVALVGSVALLVSPAFDDPAGATVVSNEAELRAAFGNATETQIDLANDITLTACADGAVSRNSTTALTLDGHGFAITQTCPERVIRNDGTGALTIRNVTITGGRTLLDAAVCSPRARWWWRTCRSPATGRGAAAAASPVSR